MSNSTKVHMHHHRRPDDRGAQAPAVPSPGPGPIRPSMPRAFLARHEVRTDVLVTRVYRRGFRPPEDFGASGQLLLLRPVAIVTISGFGLRAGDRFSWYPISEILLVTPGSTGVSSARIDFMSGARADLRVEQQWLFNRRLREAIHAFDLELGDVTAGSDWGRGRAVDLMVQAELARDDIGSTERRGRTSAAGDEVRHQAWVEELRRRRRLLLDRARDGGTPGSA